MGLDLVLLKKHLKAFSVECNVTIEEIGVLADESSSVDDFKSKLDELCPIGKTYSEVLAEFSVRFANTNSPTEPTPTENSPLQNELVEVKGKIGKLNERDKKLKVESES